MVQYRESSKELYFDHIPQGPKDRWNLDMKYFLHETHVDVPMQIVANPADERREARIECTVMASNFAQSVTKVLPCKVKIIEKDPGPIANAKLEEL